MNFVEMYQMKILLNENDKILLFKDENEISFCLPEVEL